MPVANDFGQTINLLVPRTAIQPSEVAVVVNDNDPQSVDVGNYYSLRYNIGAANVIHVAFPAGRDVISEADFTALKSQVDARLGAGIQAYALTWSRPWKVGAGMGVTSAFALGYNSRYVAPSVCNMTAAVPYYNSPSTRPYTDFGIRPAMMVGGETAEYARAVVDRGVSAQQNFPGGDGYLVRTTDSARSVRYTDFQATVTAWNRPGALNMSFIDNSTGAGLDYLEHRPNVLFYLTGLATVPQVLTNQFVPGAAADHLTSAGGILFGGTQMSVLRWLEAGATASYGTVVEPCAYTQKFPTASILVRNYFGGGTILEAYWKSVNQPGEGLFVGDPLARPFGTRAAFVNGVLTVTTTVLKPGKLYVLAGGDAAAGPYTTLQSNISVAQSGYKTITDISAPYPYYKLAETTDTTVPTVAITAPTDGAVVQGTVGLTVAASDNSGSVSSVTYSVDGVTQGTDSTAPYAFIWNSMNFGNGNHVLTAAARDAAGNVGSTSRAVMVSNAADAIAPTVSITSPAPGTVLKKGKATPVQVSVQDNVGVTRVELYVDGVLHGKSTASPFTINLNLNSKSVSAGTHWLVSKAYDAAGNAGSSAAVSVVK
jgi:uncharacterized protein (TIGR03790 family)